jgi:hypothetical protein
VKKLREEPLGTIPLGSRPASEDWKLEKDPLEQAETPTTFESFVKTPSRGSLYREIRSAVIMASGRPRPPIAVGAGARGSRMSAGPLLLTPLP